SGVVNIGLEGLMVVGFFTSALTISRLESSLSPVVAIGLGLVLATLAGAVFSLLHAFASVTLNANQVISGTAINMLAGAITVYLARHITGSGNILIMNGLIRRNVPVLSKIPILGPLFFTQTYVTTWLVLAILLLSWFLLYRTPFGLRLRACGEHPQAANAAGINVYRMRYIAVLLSGACAGLGGAIILVTYAGEFNGTVAGFGFLAPAALSFGALKPLGVFGAAFLFGSASSVANLSPGVPALAKGPGVFLKNFPYLVTLLVFVFFPKSTQAPR